MKKALSLLLAVAMLASLCTVGVWAEDEFAEVPEVEEVAEEELELFGEEIEIMAATNIAPIEPTDGDGITLLAELDGVAVTAEKNGNGNHEGAIESLSNGYLTVGDDLGGSFITNSVTGTREGFMVFKGDTITIDFGEKMAFSGIRIWDSSRTRYFGAYGTDGTGANPKPGARRITESSISFSDDGENWYQVGLTAAVYNEDGLYSDLPFTFNSNLSKTAGTDNHIENGGVMNINARYIRFAATSVTSGWGELELEEIAMLDADDTLKTWSLDGNELSHSIIESVVAGSEWNTQSYAVKNAWDNNLNLINYWHSDPENDTDEARSFTITLKEETEIGGIRLWPRNNRTSVSPYQSTASMRKVRLMGSDDGENWYNITTVSSDLHTAYSVGGYCMPVDVIIPGNVDSNVKYLKVVAEKVDAYVCLAEFQLLSADIKEDVSAYVTDDDVVVWKTTPVELAYYSSLGKTRNTAASVFDGQVHQVINKGEGYYCIWPTANNDPHWEIDHAMADNGYVTVDFDLGKSYTFSAARIFSRWNQPGQALTKGYVLISDDGENWYKSDLHQDSGTTVGTDITGAELSRVNLAKYASTDEIYTNIPASFGENYNVTARYIRIYCAATSGNHWSFQELMLVKPDDTKATKTVSEIAAILAEEAAEAEAIINALGASPEMADINAARNAYDALPDGAKDLVAPDVYKKLTDAEVFITGATYEMSVSLSTGINKATFTLPVRDNMEIKSVKYLDTLGREIDGTDAVAVTNDGTAMTITMAGGYETKTGLTAYSDGSKGTLYFATANATYGWTAGQVIEPSFFTGSFVRKVVSDGVGDHYITITFGDDTTATVNIKTTSAWVQLSSAAAIEGGEYTDEITPKTTWKATTTTRNRDMNMAFDGKTEYLIRKGGATSGNRYESDFIAGKQTANADLSGGVDQVLLYPPVRLDFMVDTGEETAISGIRIYPRVSVYNEDKTKGSAAGAPTQITYWGSDDGENWTKLGDYTFTISLEEKTALFSSVASYRYYKGSVIKASGLEYKQTISISEITFLKPQTVLASTDKVTVDEAESTVAEFTFALAGTETVTSVKEGTNDAEYSFADGVLSFDEDYIASLADGEYAFVVTFSNGQNFTVTVVKADTSKVSYLLYGASGGSGNLVLPNPAAKAVKTLKLADGTELPFTLSADNSTITVVRQFFKRSTDLFALVNVDKGGEVTVTATFEDETTKNYTVSIDAEWTDVAGTTGEFADDEIKPTPGAWKARVSSGQNGYQAGNVLSVKKVGKKDEQNWHTFFGAVEGTVYGDSTKDHGHYFDVDFGENVAPYTGIRHLERPGGTTWNVNVRVMGKNSAAEEWTEIYNAKPYYEKIGEYVKGENVAPIYSSDILFGKAVSYRYVRIHIKSTSEHITADTIHFIKDKVTFNGPEKVVLDKDNVTDAKFTFHVPTDAEGIINVWVSSVTLDEANYTWDKDTGILTIKADYLKTLGTGTFKVEAQVDSSEYFEMFVELKDYYTETYYFTESDNARGTDNLVISVPEGKTLSTLKYGDKDVTFTQTEDKATVLRYNFRGLDNFFGVEEVALNATFSDTTTATYTINLVTEWFGIPAFDEASFSDDEILPYEYVRATTLSTNSDEHLVSRLFSKTGAYWHSAYTEDRTNPDNVRAVADSEEGRHYIQLSVYAEGIKFSGIRYYARTDNLAGTWDGVSVYVKTLDDEEWTLVKSQNFDKTTLNETRIATVYFDEPVYANMILFVADAGSFKYATAKALTLLKPGAKAPDAEEGQVKVTVTPTTGGNAYVNGTPSVGDNYVDANEEITLTADTQGFKYWIDANTGKILGTNASELKITATEGKNIKAVFADPSSFEAFVSFIGRNEGSVISSGYVRKGEKAVAPSDAQLYQTGYTFIKWVDENGADVNVDAAITESIDFYAVYEANATTGNITVTDGMVSLADGSDEAAAEKTYAYNTKVKAVADAAPVGEKFAYWTLNGEIVCYTKTYIFFVPDMDAELVANFVAKDSDVEKAVNIALDVTTTTVGDTLVASFLTTRIIPEDVQVIETGVIYVKDGSVDMLTVENVGSVTANGKKVKVSLSSNKASGQYKLTAGYTEGGGISARGFITYLDGETVKTVYTAMYVIEGGAL